MRSFLLAVAAFAVASVNAFFVFPDTVPLHRRQAPGTPQYDCHSDCGGIISMSRTEGYCDNANFTTTLQACLECAMVYDIWQYYGDSVTNAANTCGVDATPVAANTTDAATATSGADPTATPAPESASDASSETAAATSAMAEASETAASTMAEASATATASEAASETEDSTVAQQTDNAGNKAILGGGLAMVPLGAALAGLL